MAIYSTASRRFAAVGMALVISAVPILALGITATSGLVYRSTVNAHPYGNVRVCLLADVSGSDGFAIFNYGEIRTYDTSSTNCGGAVSLGTGFHGVTLDGYRNGAFCGTTYYRYSPSPGTHMVARDDLCFNLWGTQNFHTNVFGRVYSSSCGCYHNIPGISSPGINA